MLGWISLALLHIGTDPSNPRSITDNRRFALFRRGKKWHLKQCVYRIPLFCTDTHHKYIITWPRKLWVSSQNTYKEEEKKMIQKKKKEKRKSSWAWGTFAVVFDTKYCTLSYKHHTRIYKNIDRINWVQQYIFKKRPSYKSGQSRTGVEYVGDVAQLVKRPALLSRERKGKDKNIQYGGEEREYFITINQWD